jgi:L-rhamnose mutarotase
MQRFCFALDLKNDAQLIAEYERYHQNVWPEIIEQIKSTGIICCEIYRVMNRLFMIVEAADDFSLEQKAKADAENELVQKWEQLMWNYQQALPIAKPGEKWMLMKKIFEL